MANYNAEFCEEAAETAFIVHAESGRLRGAGGVSAGNPRMESKKGKKKRRRKTECLQHWVTPLGSFACSRIRRTGKTPAATAGDHPLPPAPLLAVAHLALLLLLGDLFKMRGEESRGQTQVQEGAWSRPIRCSLAGLRHFEKVGQPEGNCP